MKYPDFESNNGNLEITTKMRVLVITHLSHDLKSATAPKIVMLKSQMLESTINNS